MAAMTNWQPIETKPPFTHVEERGEYRTDDGMLWYFKPTHWRPLQCCDNYPSCYCDQER